MESILELCDIECLIKSNKFERQNLRYPVLGKIFITFFVLVFGTKFPTEYLFAASMMWQKRRSPERKWSIHKGSSKDLSRELIETFVGYFGFCDFSLSTHEIVILFRQFWSSLNHTLFRLMKVSCCRAAKLLVDFVNFFLFDWLQSHYVWLRQLSSIVDQFYVIMSSMSFRNGNEYWWKYKRAEVNILYRIFDLVYP